FPHIMCIIITVIICIFITNQSGEIFSQGTEDIIVDYEQGQIDDYLEYRDTFFLQVESDESLSPEMANQLPVRGNADRSGRPEIVTYTVKKGDTLWSLAKSYGTDVNTIVNTNNIRNPNSLKIGQKILILTTNGVIHSVSRGESLWTISRRYNTTVDQIAWANEIKNPNALKVGQELIIPDVKPVLSQTAASSNKASVKGMNFMWPTQGKISSYFGNRKGGFHYGLDIACPYGRTIQASESGKVEFVGWLKGYGRTVLINHGGGIKTRYAHASKITVNKGENVTRGQKIAEIGNSGKSTGPHLHFEIIIDGKPRDPLNYLP
ncbi:MAG TPA: M23 family metallopeptidase, partial [Thermoanaerobacterales bacterium]|nr:M23 family metallopeptidase [Thermoanaerobacterales bacterium]